MCFVKNAIKEPYKNGVYKLFHDNDNYYLKIGDAFSIHQEASNYASAKRLLQDVVKIECPEEIQLDFCRSALLMKDYGDTLETAIKNGYAHPVAISEVCDLLLEFITRGILWGGFVPRNLFAVKGIQTRFRGIDLEDFYLLTHAPDEISSLFVMKWSLGWEGFLQENITASEIYLAITEALSHKGITISNSTSLMSLDEFEDVYHRLFPSLPSENIRDICTAKTLLSEGGVFVYGDHYSFFNLGHTMEDLLLEHAPDTCPYLSVFFTCALHFLRENQSDKELLLYHFIHQYQERKDIQSIFSLLIQMITGENFPIIAKEKQFGLSKAIERAKIYEETLNLCLQSLKIIFDIQHVDIWLRGSAASGICSVFSDVDFEIHEISDQQLNKLELEKLIICLLGIFDIPAEGTLGRPDEDDFICALTQDTRDLHELMELRLLNDNSRIVDTLQSYQLPSKWWRKRSIYENEDLVLNGKNVFFETRSILLRYVLDTQYGNSNHIPSILNSVSNATVFQTLKDNLKKSLIAYENNDFSLAQAVANSNSSLSGELGFPTLKYKMKRTE